MTYDPAVLHALEPDQTAAATMRPFPRRRLGKGALGLVVLLRVYVALAIPVIVYAFVHALRANP
jgi:hypothetical protein